MAKKEIAKADLPILKSKVEDLVKQYNAAELTPLFKMAQKKTSQEEQTAYLSDMMLLTALSTTRKQMTMEEARRILRERPMDSAGK